MYSAVSKSMFWLTVAMTPFLIRHLMTSAAVFFIREASSPTVISSGILTVSGVFLMASRRRRLRRLRSSSRDLALLPPCCFLFLLPIFCLPPVRFWSRSEIRVSAWSSKRAALTWTAEVSTTRRSRLRWGSAGFFSAGFCAPGLAFWAGAGFLSSGLAAGAAWAAFFASASRFAASSAFFFSSASFLAKAAAKTVSTEAI